MTNVVTAPDSIQPASINFSDLMSKAMAHPAGNESEPASAPVIETPTPAPVVPDITTPAPEVVAASPVPAAPVVSPAEVKILDLQDSDQVRVKIDGKEEVVPFKDFREGISREAVFTRRMQTLADQRKEAEAQLAAQYADIQRQGAAVELAKSELAKFYQTPQTVNPNNPVPGAPPAVDPAELATMGDVQSTLDRQLAQLRSENKLQQEEFVKALGQASQQVQSQAQLQRDSQIFTNHLNTVMDKPEYKILARVSPYADEIVRQKVAAMEPKSIQEAMQFAETYVKGWHTEVVAAAVETAKRHEVAKAQAKIEPPAGSPAPPVAQFKPGSSFTKDGKFDWAALRARAEGML